MSNAVSYLMKRYYQKGLAHNVRYSVITCIVVAIVAFNFGRSVEYLSMVKHIDGMIAEKMEVCQ